MINIVRILPYQNDPAPITLWVTNVFPLADYNLLILFNNGERRIFDCKSIIYKPEFISLLDKAKFNNAIVYEGNVAWPDETIGLCSEALYIQIQPADNMPEVLFTF